MDDSKIFEAKATLQLASEMSDYYYHKPLIVCYSGGKDSDVLLDIARKCLKPSEFEVLNSHTTVDAPETVYHIREVFRGLEKDGIKATIKIGQKSRFPLVNSPKLTYNLLSLSYKKRGYPSWN